MKIIKTTVYSYDELSKEAQARAYKEWKENDQSDYMLEPHLGNLLKEELEERGIKYDTDSINVLYSLGYCQGDGLMFEGTLYPDYGEGHKYTAYIKHSGHYYHKYSRIIDWREEDGADGDTDARDYKDFEKTYNEICSKIEQFGYDEIEYQQSEEVFQQMCEANEYTFTKEGKMFN